MQAAIQASNLNVSSSARESTLMLSATKHLGPANEILRFAQDDTKIDEVSHLPDFVLNTFQGKQPRFGRQSPTITR